MKRIFEKSVVAARDLPAGHVLAEADLAYKKPGDGIPASRYQELVGRKLKRAGDGRPSIRRRRPVLNNPTNEAK